MSHRATKLLALSLLAVLGVGVLATNVGFVGGAAAANGSQVDVDVTSLEGDGSEANPYVITNASELQAINDDLEANYTLGDDVNASGTADWNSGEGFDPIGNCPNSFSKLHEVCSGTSFNGTFDGNGHTISDLYVNRSNGTGVGLFALASNAAFENVRMENVTVRGDENVGGLVGQLETGTIQNVSVTGDVDGGIVSSGEPDGGKVGGIVGIAGNAQVDPQVVFKGNVTGGYNVGGLVGRMRLDTVVHNSYAHANVTANEELGNDNNDEAGGIAGNSGTSSEFENLYFAGSVEADGSAGAIVGNSTDNGADNFTNVYWEEDAASQGSGGNVNERTNYTSLSTTEMQGSAASEHMNLDFGDSWVLVDGEFPVLQWEAAGAEIVDITAANVTAAEGEQAQVTVNATDEFGKAADGENVTIAANDDGLEGISVGGTAITNASGQATFAFAEPNFGEYVIAFTAANDSLSDTANVTVEVTDVNEPPADDDDDSDQSDDDDTDETPESVVIESSQNTTTVTVTAIDGLRTIGIENLTTTVDSVDGNNADPTTGPKNVTLESLTVTVEDVPDGSLNVTARELQRDGPVSTTTDLTAERRGFTSETGAVPIGEVTVEHTISEDRISNATFAFSIRKAYLESGDVAPEDVDLFRNESTGWNAVSTSQASENSTHYHFRAESPGFSRFVVGTSRPMFDVASISLDTDVLERGESATVTASIENVGNVTGSRDVDLVVDSEHEATTSVLVEARSTEAVSFDVSPSTTGTYQLMIGDRTTTLVVERASQPDPPGDEESESTDDGLPWIGILIVILTGILLTVLFLVRRRDVDVFDRKE